MESHDAHLLLDDLLAHRDWVRSLAVRLVRDTAIADDLTQETWLAALRSPPRERVNLRGWLARVVHNAARSHGRAGGRRSAREARVAEDVEEAPSADELVEKVETHRRLAARVLELEEPLRQVVLLRYFEGHSSAEIAKRLGIPAGTVRWRLKRGLDELRVKLDGDFGDRRAWCLALAPFVRRELVSRSGAGVGAGGGLLALLASVGTVPGLALLVGALLSPVWWSPLTSLLAGDPPQAQERSAPVFSSAQPQDPSPSEATRGVARQDGGTPVDPDAENLRAKLIVLAGDGLPLAGAVVRSRQSADPLATTDENGVALVPLPGKAAKRGSGRLFVEAPDHVPGERLFRRGTGSLIDAGTLRLQSAGAIAGRVFDAQGNPVAGAWIEIDDPPRRGEPVDRGQRLERSATRGGDVQTDRAGYFRIERRPTGRRRVWAKVEGSLAACVSVDVRSGETTRDVELHLDTLAPDDFYHGVVIDADGEPVPYAVLIANFGRSTRAALAGEDGEFWMPWEPRVPFTLEVKDSENRYPALFLEGLEGSADARTVRFGAARWIEIEVTGDGKPLTDFYLTVQGKAGSRDLYSTRADASETSPEKVPVPGEEFHVWVGAAGYESSTVGPFHPGEIEDRIRVELRASAALAGFVCLGEEPLEGVTVTLHESSLPEGKVNGFPARYGSYMNEAKGITGADGSFSLPVPRAGSYFVRAQAEGFAPTDVGPLELDPALGPGDLELQLTRGGILEGRIEGEGGRLILLSRGDGDLRQQRAGSDGVFRFTNLTPGPWLATRVSEFAARPRYAGDAQRARLDADGLPSNCIVREGSVTRLVLGAQGPPVTLSGHFLLDGEVPEGWTALLLRRTENVSVGTLSPKGVDLRSDGSFMLQGGSPGPYRLMLLGPGASEGQGPLLTAELDLEVGETPWSRSLSTGSLRVMNPGSGQGSYRSAYHVKIVHDGFEFLAPLDSEAEKRTALARGLPGGTARVLRVPLEVVRVAGPARPEASRVLLEVDVVPGSTIEVRLP